MPLGTPKEITDCRRFFLEPQHSKQRQYEALRRYFVDGRSSKEVAAEFGYTEGSFRVLCHHFRRDPEPAFFLIPTRGPQSQPKKSAARATIEHLRKRNHSVYEIAEALKEQGTALSATAVREVLRELGFAALPRRLDEERPDLPRPTVESAADARVLNLSPRRFPTRCGGLFLFVPDLVRLGLEQMADTARLPGSNLSSTVGNQNLLAGWPRAVTHPRLPRFRACPIRAPGSSDDGLAAQRYTLCTTRAAGRG